MAQLRARLGGFGDPTKLAIGLIVSGIGTVVMIMITSRTLDPHHFAAFATWWLTVTLMGPVFVAFEVYLGRALLAGGSTTGRTEDVLRQISGLALLAVLTVALLILPLTPILAIHVFGGIIWAPLTIPFFALNLAVQSIQRGVATSRQTFGAISLQYCLDGFLRPVLVGVAAVLGYEWLLYLAPTITGLVAVWLASIWLRDWLLRPKPFTSAVSVRPIGWLLVAAVGPVLVGNLSAPWFAAAASSAALIGAFAGALSLSRLPTQMVYAIFSPLMARLSLAIERDDQIGFERLLSRSRALALGLAVAFVAAFTVFGEMALAFYIGTDYYVPVWVLTALAAASGGLFVASIQQAALTAQNSWSIIAVAWTAGSAAFIATLVTPLDALVRASCAPLVAVLVASAVMATGRRRPKGPVGESWAQEG